MFDDFIERNRDVLVLLARILMMALFLVSGWSKLTGFESAVGYMASVHAPLPQLAAAVAVTMELFVGLALVLGIWVRPLALLYVLFVLGTGVLGHPFWLMEGAERAAATIQFLKNLSIVGGLLLLAVTGAGRYALTGHGRQHTP